MNLLYALHYYGLATCPIIWGSEPDNDKKYEKYWIFRNVKLSPCL